MTRQTLELSVVLRLRAAYARTRPAASASDRRAGPRVSRRAHRRAVAERRAEYARVVAAREALLAATATEELRRSDVALAG